MTVKSKLKSLFVILLMMILPFMNSTKSIDVNFDMKKNEINSPVFNYGYDGFIDEVISYSTMYTSDADISFNGFTSAEYGNIEFYCSFDFTDLCFYGHYETEEGSYDEYIQGYLNKNGGVCAELEYHNLDTCQDETYNIDDYKDIYELEKFVYQTEEPVEEDDEIYEEISLFPILKFTLSSIIGVVVVYVVIAEIAEQIQADNNYVHNRALELCDDGVYYGNTIFNQEETNRDGYDSGNYKLGFADFGDVGCEAVSVYNLLIRLGKTEYLSDVIYEFERWLVEFSVGWGNLGSNPREIANFLSAKGISYEMKKNTIISTLFPKYDYKIYKQMVDEYILYDNFIISYWNGFLIHTYYFERSYEKGYDFKAYNNKEIETFQKIEETDDLLEDGERFIVGYLIL